MSELWVVSRGMWPRRAEASEGQGRKECPGEGLYLHLNQYTSLPPCIYLLGLLTPADPGLRLFLFCVRAFYF